MIAHVFIKALLALYSSTEFFLNRKKCRRRRGTFAGMKIVKWTRNKKFDSKTNLIRSDWQTHLRWALVLRSNYGDCPVCGTYATQRPEEKCRKKMATEKTSSYCTTICWSVAVLGTLHARNAAFCKDAVPSYILMISSKTNDLITRALKFSAYSLPSLLYRRLSPLLT